MNPRDPLNDIFKKLEHSESNDISSKEKVWAMLENKLEQPARKETKELSLSRKWLAAAAVILFAGVTYLFVKPTGKQTPIMVKTETVGKTDTPTEPSKTPQTIAQNDITKDQVEKIKEEKKKLNTPKDIIAYQEPSKAEAYYAAPSPAISPSANYALPSSASTGIEKNTETSGTQVEKKEERVMNNTKNLSLKREIASVSTSPSDNAKGNPISITEAYKNTVSASEEGIITSTKGIRKKSINNNDINTSSYSSLLTDSVSKSQENIYTRFFKICETCNASTKAPLYIINNKKYLQAQKVLEKLPSEKIKEISVINEQDAIKQYGSEAKNGAIIIKTKRLDRTLKRQLKQYLMKDSL
ncbi:hypothetical protein HZP42_03575 [Elizabethkingia anophelis]|nr:hypothetical protein [Elizabethkingia anophelis]